MEGGGGGGGGGLKNIFISQINPTNTKIKKVHLYMDVNEHERLSISHSDTNVKGENFYCCSTFHSHSRWSIMSVLVCTQCVGVLSIISFFMRKLVIVV